MFRALGPIPLPRRPLDASCQVRRWYENELGWPTVPGDPLRLVVGVRYDILDVPAEAGHAALRHLGPRSPVAVLGDRMRLLVAPGSAEELPGLLEWLEWGTLRLDLTAIGAGGAVEAPWPPGMGTPSCHGLHGPDGPMPRERGALPPCAARTSFFRETGGSTPHARGPLLPCAAGAPLSPEADGSMSRDRGALPPCETGGSTPHARGPLPPCQAGAPLFRERGSSMPRETGGPVPDESDWPLPCETGGSTPHARGPLLPCAAGAPLSPEAGGSVSRAWGGPLSREAWMAVAAEGGGALPRQAFAPSLPETDGASSPEPGFFRGRLLPLGRFGSQGAAVWLRPPEPGCEVEASLPTLSALGGGGDAPDLVRLVNTVATQCHRVRLRRACAQPPALRAQGR